MESAEPTKKRNKKAESKLPVLEKHLLASRLKRVENSRNRDTKWMQLEALNLADNPAVIGQMDAEEKQLLTDFTASRGFIDKVSCTVYLSRLLNSAQYIQTKVSRRNQLSKKKIQSDRAVSKQMYLKIRVPWLAAERRFLEKIK